MTRPRPDNGLENSDHSAGPYEHTGAYALGPEVSDPSRHWTPGADVRVDLPDDPPPLTPEAAGALLRLLLNVQGQYDSEPNKRQDRT